MVPLYKFIINISTFIYVIHDNQAHRVFTLILHVFIIHIFIILHIQRCIYIYFFCVSRDIAVSFPGSFLSTSKHGRKK